jgi:hypothetical protein
MTERESTRIWSCDNVPWLAVRRVLPMLVAADWWE